MAGRPSRRRGSPASGHRYPRSARVGETLREIIAEELVRIDDERLEFVTITGVDVDNELNRAIVFFDSLAGADGDEEIVEQLNEHRQRLQSSINRQIRAKKTPVLQFRPDEVIRAAERIDEIIRADLRSPATEAASDRSSAGASSLASEDESDDDADDVSDD